MYVLVYNMYVLIWSMYVLVCKYTVCNNNLYRKILHVPPRSSANKMFVDNNIPNFVALLRKEVFSFSSRLNVSTNSIIRAIENCWLIKYVIWKPWYMLTSCFYNYISCHIYLILCCIFYISTFDWLYCLNLCNVR